MKQVLRRSFLGPRPRVSTPHKTKTQRKYKAAYVRLVFALQKHGYLVFNGHGVFPSCFRVGNERSCFRHISVNMIFAVEWKA